jgi:hypothetical protein
MMEIGIRRMIRQMRDGFVQMSVCFGFKRKKLKTFNQGDRNHFAGVRLNGIGNSTTSDQMTVSPGEYLKH